MKLRRRKTTPPVRGRAGHSCHCFRVPYSVHFEEHVKVPAELRARAFEILVQIARAWRTISQSSAFWSAANAGNAELNLPGWQFEYRIHHRDRRILVVGAWQLGDHQVG